MSFSSMIRSAGLESSGSIPQTSSRNVLPALLASSTIHPHQQQQPQQFSQTPTRYQQTQTPLPSALQYSYLPRINYFSFLPYSRQQRKSEFLLRSSPMQRLQPQAPLSSRCCHSPARTGFVLTPDYDHGYDHEVVRLREWGLGCRWKEGGW
jgi:hypothetical protein